MVNELAQTPTEELELVRSLPSWHARVQSAHTILREMIGARDYAFDPARFRDLDTRTLLMVGGDSPPFYRAAVDALHVSLPHNRVATLSGQQHEAMETAPELFLREVISFFERPSCRGDGGNTAPWFPLRFADLRPPTLDQASSSRPPLDDR